MLKFLENTGSGEIEFFPKLCFEVKMFLPNWRKNWKKSFQQIESGKLKQKQNNLQRWVKFKVSSELALVPGTQFWELYRPVKESHKENNKNDSLGSMSWKNQLKNLI